MVGVAWEGGTMAPPCCRGCSSSDSIRLFAAPHVKGWSWCTGDAETKVVAETKEVSTVQWFGENVCNVVTRPNSSNSEFPIMDHIANVVEFHSNVFHMGMEYVVLCETGGCIVVAMKGGRSGFREAEAIQ